MLTNYHRWDSGGFVVDTASCLGVGAVGGGFLPAAWGVRLRGGRASGGCQEPGAPGETITSALPTSEDEDFLKPL